MKSSHFGVQSSDFLVNPWVNPQIVQISLNPWIYWIDLRIFKFSPISLIHSINSVTNTITIINSKSSVLDFSKWLNPFETYSIYSLIRSLLSGQILTLNFTLELLF